MNGKEFITALHSICKEKQISEDVIYQDQDGTWMVQPEQKEGRLIEPHALYLQSTAPKNEKKEDESFYNQKRNTERLYRL